MLKSDISNTQKTNCCLTEQTTGLQNFVLENNEFRKYLVPDPSNNLFLPKSDLCALCSTEMANTQAGGSGGMEKEFVANAIVSFFCRSMSPFLLTWGKVLFFCQESSAFCN